MPRDDDETKKNPTETMATFFSVNKSERQSDLVLDIPKIPFNTDRYKKALTSGYCVTKEYDEFIDIGRLHAPHDKPGSGYGTAKFREIIQRSITLKCPGEIVTEASTNYGSPHLFYLYMGMAPKTYPVRYLEYQYGIWGGSIGDKLNIPNKFNTWDTKEIEKEFDQDELECLTRIIYKETGITEKRKIISLEDIAANKELLLKLSEKTIDYTSGVFIPKLLKILALDPNNKYPFTKSLGATSMYLTKQGYARWKFVIENNLEFIPFRNLEHLNLSLEQRALLKEVLDKRNVTKTAQPRMI